MSDRRAVSAGRGASSVAAAHEPWRVAVGGNRVESMTVDQIAQAFHAGHLNVRTPLWPPGTTGWQALGNFEQFQMHPVGYGQGAPQQSPYGAAGGLAQFEEADDDPTRMWTGGPEDLPGLEAYGMSEPPPLEPRPLARTGTRQVVAQPPAQMPMPMQSRPVAAASGAPPSVARPAAAMPAPMASLPPSRNPAVAHSSMPPFRKSRGNGLMLVAGLVGLVGLGSAVLATRGNWGSATEAAATEAEASQAEATSAAANEAPASEAKAAEAPATAAPAAPAAAEASTEKPVSGEAQLAKYEDGTSSAFVAGEQKPTANEAKVPASSETKADDAADEPESSKREAAKQENEPTRAEKTARSGRHRSDDTPSKKSRAVPKRAALAKSKAAAVAAPRAEKAEAPEKADKPEKAAAEAQQAPANAAVNEAAAAALASSANLASSCRPRGGPSGPGKARVIYSNDGEVQSVEILTAKFRDTLTGSCVRMVFRRAKIPAFKGEPPTFIKSFTIPEE